MARSDIFKKALELEADVLDLKADLQECQELGYKRLSQLRTAEDTVERLQALHLERTHSTHVALTSRDARIRELNEDNARAWAHASAMAKIADDLKEKE